MPPSDKAVLKAAQDWVPARYSLSSFASAAVASASIRFMADSTWALLSAETLYSPAVPLPGNRSMLGFMQTIHNRPPFSSITPLPSSPRPLNP